jgi:NADH-quinone oxidoreductase subunit F
VLLTRDPARGPEPLADYVSRDGYAALADALSRRDPAAVVRAVTEAGLTGRGGAGFPTGRKWGMAAGATAPQKWVVANGGEHEPGSQKDRVLVATRPHLVLEGMALCGFATGATKGVLYLIEDMDDALRAAERAIDEARAAGHLGADLYATGWGFDVTVHRAPTTYVAGEETAALNAIEGKPAKPRQKPPYPGERGLHGQPTTVNNVETLAHVPAIVRNGADWFRGLGTPGAPGTMLFTLPANVRRPGVYELPFGATFRELIEGCGGGLADGRAVKAILPAASAQWLGADALDWPLDPVALRASGASLGCGGVTLVAEGECLVERVEAIARFFMKEQCGQCPPCRMLTNTYAAVVGKVRGGDAGDYAAQLDKVAGFAIGKGYCSLIAMAAAPVRSAVARFPADFAHHAAHGRCPGAA